LMDQSLNGRVPGITLGRFPGARVSQPLHGYHPASRQQGQGIRLVDSSTVSKSPFRLFRRCGSTSHMGAEVGRSAGTLCAIIQRRQSFAPDRIRALVEEGGDERVPICSPASIQARARLAGSDAERAGHRLGRPMSASRLRKSGRLASAG
jgi:hypothetical protein